MTSVPKPLKFLRPYYPDLQILFDAWPASENKVQSKPFRTGFAYHHAESVC